ncbi:peptide ABC transporter ATP-binding protein [Erwinia sp. OLTSP20]|uniref:ABC transporter ATP-binding protein n=1 Tax=unclassified Erwinia TaxID=2622719 RepID=UPI000C18BBD1|nr:MULTISPECIES: ABC transporter ATP-binding protein [unclassified Erwinia]PIJ49403.1 peptide ABC transporter ATP-binding protein [Erwinia sp. OAMSP11]PIJ71079.1 peptide ABC transporter ATP-binding protein [Erwinia sp. OLSSP12]PIJ79357.1 peptide ABC transporter ATP-binding protein [Erwinia sp. OLCASP19]PIJ80895.1 peptide ABC transporter ATP-binding protein [Erwinia sp. OLMTSP26]PIJ83697.1 peptide ABC transporter ATP-binding protein [Erwinia sp. OLMDSP33]
MSLLDIDDLSVTYASPDGPLKALRNISLTLDKGEVLGLVGESGSGKSTLVSALLTLLPDNATTHGQLRWHGNDLLALPAHARRQLRGNGIATVSQDPFTALNPVLTIGKQLVAFQHHQAASRREKQARAIAMLARVGISDPAGRMKQYPHELSGGIRQRIAIAAALLTRPELLIADEPTTALDATTEMQVVELLKDSRRLVDGAMIFVTHDLHLLATLCDKVAVMYAGELIETGPCREVFASPSHPYTRALLACDPARIDTPTRELPFIAGSVPVPGMARRGCPFQPRCAEAFAPCERENPPAVLLAGGGRMVCCHKVKHDA